MKRYLISLFLSLGLSSFIEASQSQGHNTVDETALIEKYHKTLTKYQKFEKDWHKASLNLVQCKYPDRVDRDTLKMKYENRELWEARCESFSIRANKLGECTEKLHKETFELSSIVNAYIATKNMLSTSSSQTQNSNN